MRWHDAGDRLQRALLSKAPLYAQSRARLCSGSRKALGLGLPGCGSGVTDPTAGEMSYARGDDSVVPPPKHA